MAVRRSLAKELDTPTPRQRRRSLRLERKKGTPFGSVAYHGLTTTTDNLTTPRTLLRKVLQTQPIVSPLVPEKPDSSKPVETVFQFPSGIAPHSSLELNLSDPVPKDAPRTTCLKARTKKKVRLSEFERVLDKQLASNTATSLVGNTTLTRSLQISFATPEPLDSAGKRGLIRRPKNYRGVNVKAFEEGIEQNLLQIKDAQHHLVDLQATTLLSNDTEAHLTDTELFAQPQLSRQSGSGLSVLRSRPSSIRKSLPGQTMLPFIQTPPKGATFAMDVEGVMRTGQKENLTAEAGCADGTEAAPEERAVSSREEPQETLQDAEGGLKCSNRKEATPGTEEADGMCAGSRATAVIPEREQQESLDEKNNDLEQCLSSGVYLVSGIGTARTSTPAGVKLPRVHPGSLSSFMHKKTAKRSVKEMVTHIIKELDSSVASAIVNRGGSEANLEEELPPREGAMRISQRTEAGTPSRRASRKDPERLRRPSTRERVDEQAGCSGEMREAEDAEMDPEAAELSGVETESENDEPTGKTPTFVRTRAFRCSPLLSTPHSLQVTASKSSSKPPLIKRVPKQTTRLPRGKREPSLPSSFVKKLFSHYARMPVSKDAFKAVERCVNLYFKNLSRDLGAYTNHAGRKTIEPADLELLMRRQGLITDNMPLNVLIERHLPLEYRKLLIPVATSGNKVVPRKLR